MENKIYSAKIEKASDFFIGFFGVILLTAFVFIFLAGEFVKKTFNWESFYTSVIIMLILEIGLSIYLWGRRKFIGIGLFCAALFKALLSCVFYFLSTTAGQKASGEFFCALLPILLKISPFILVIAILAGLTAIIAFLIKKKDNKNKAVAFLAIGLALFFVIVPLALVGTCFLSLSKM